MADKGRPNSYTEELANEICERLETGETLSSICKDKHMPAVRTVSGWKKTHEGFSANFARARDLGFDAIAESILEIADTPMEGEEKTIDDEGRVTVRTFEMTQHRKLQIETRFKLLSKWDPRRYGDKLDLTTDGKGLPPTTTTVVIVPPTSED